MAIRLSGGGRGGGGGLHFRDPPDVFANVAARSTYFTTAPNDDAYLEFVSDRSLAIIIGTIANPTDFQTYTGDSGAYDANAWVSRVDAVQGRMGFQGQYRVLVYTTSAGVPTPAAPTGISIVVATAALTLPTGITSEPTAPGTGEDIYVSQYLLNPSQVSGTITPVFSNWVEYSHLSAGISHVASSADFGGQGTTADPLTLEKPLTADELNVSFDLGDSTLQDGARFDYAEPTGYTAGGWPAVGVFVQFNIGTVSSPDDSDVQIRVGSDDYDLTTLGGLVVKLHSLIDDTPYIAFGKGTALVLMGPADGSGSIVDVTESGLPAPDAEAIGKIYTNNLIPAAWMVHEVRHAQTPVMGSFDTYTSPRNTGDTFDLYRGAHGADPTSIRVGSTDQNLDSRHVGAFYYNWRDGGFRVWTSTFNQMTSTFDYHWQTAHHPADRLVAGGTGEYIGHANTDADLLARMPQDSIDTSRVYVGVATNLTGNGVIHVRTFDNSTYVAAVNPFNVYDFVTIGLYGQSAAGGQTLAQVTAAIQAAINALIDSAPSDRNTLNELSAAIDTGDALALEKAQNLADLANAATARTNLGLGSAAEVDTGTDPGDVPVLDSNSDLDVGLIPTTVARTSALQGLIEDITISGNTLTITLVDGTTVDRTLPSGGGTGGFGVEDLFSGDIDVGTANQWLAVGTTAVPSDAEWLLWNGGKLADDDDDGPAALWTWINANDWRALTADTVGSTPGDGTGMLMVDWAATNIGDGTPDFARRDAVIGRTSANIPLITSTNDDENFIGAQLKYVTASGGGSGGFTLRFGTTAPDDSLGDDGDWYINTTSGEFSQRASGSYEIRYTDMVGAAGTMDGVITSIAMATDGAVTVERSQGLTDVTANFSAAINAMANARVNALALRAAQNLADLADVMTARGNLGLNAAGIKSLYEGNDETNAFTDTLLTKLNGIATGATDDQSAQEILTALLTVDGPGSGLDADVLDGQTPAEVAALILAAGGQFTMAVSGLDPTADQEFATKSYVDGRTSTPTHTSDQYVAVKATSTFAAADFTGANGVAFSDGSVTATIPDTIDGNIFVGLARLMSDPDATYLDIGNFGSNQIGGTTIQATTVEISGSTYEVRVTNNAGDYGGSQVEYR